MRSIALAAILAAITSTMLDPGRAEAHPWNDRNVGLGLVFYEPTGLTAEFRLSGSQSLDFTLGLDTFSATDAGYLHLQYLVDAFEIHHDGSLAVPVYLGLGPYLYDHNRSFDDDVHLGLRVPFGLALEFRPPIQLFFELGIRAPLVEFDHDDRHDHGTDLDGAIGFRLFF